MQPKPYEVLPGEFAGAFRFQDRLALELHFERLGSVHSGGLEQHVPQGLLFSSGRMKSTWVSGPRRVYVRGVAE